jgi:hypothetical protein
MIIWYYNPVRKSTGQKVYKKSAGYHLGDAIYMKKTEFLKELEAALRGEVSQELISENLRYYDNYISQETSGGRSEAEVIEEIGSPRLIAKTIIDTSGGSGSYESGESSGSSSYGGAGNSSGNYGSSQAGYSKFHYINLNKWYWKLLITVILCLVLFIVLSIVGGIFAILFRFATPIIIVLLAVSLFRNMRGR